jgi:hypothetical protein
MIDETSEQTKDVGSRGPVRPHTVGGVEAAVRGDATIQDLAMVLAGWPRPILTDIPVFACTRCGRRTATVVSASRWTCRQCRYAGTVFALRRVVLEDAELCDRLMDLLAEPIADGQEAGRPDVWAAS